MEIHLGTPLTVDYRMPLAMNGTLGSPRLQQSRRIYPAEQSSRMMNRMGSSPLPKDTVPPAGAPLTILRIRHVRPMESQLN